MSEWSRGYPAETPYTTGFQPFFAPAQLALVCALAGVVWEPPEDLTLLELGCGRGFTPCLLAASEPRWRLHGIDYAPAHVSEARSLAAEAGLPHASFEEADLAALGDSEIDRLPECDVIALHGLWTWVEDPVRAGILRVIRRRLKPGGLVYLGYNALPGFAADHALQRFLRGAAMAARGNPTERILAAIDRLRRFAEAKPAQLRRTPLLERLLDPAATFDPAYLAHEFLTAHWRPAFFADVAAALATARCEYVGSATLWENMSELVFDEAQRPFLDGIEDGAERELLKDLCLARPFRRDVFVRGLRRTDRSALLEATTLAATAELGAAPKIAVQHGVAELPPAMAEPILARLAEGPASLGELRRAPAGPQPNLAELAVLLVGSGAAQPWRPASSGGEAARAFNLAAARRYAALPGAQLALAGTHAAGGVTVSGGELAIAAEVIRQGVAEPDPVAIVRASLPHLPAESLAEAADSVRATLAARLGAWRRLGAV